MNINEIFIANILKEEYPTDYQVIYDNSPLLQYLDMKMAAVHGNSKTRRSLANIYAIYSILYFYQHDFYNQKSAYCQFNGYDYIRLFNFYRGLYGGSKLQNHALNSRVNAEFRNKIKNVANNLIITNNGKYLIFVDYIYVLGRDISPVACKIIEKYVDILMEKDHALLNFLDTLRLSTDYVDKRAQINTLLTEDSEARVFEIVSYAILRNYYKNIYVLFGNTPDTICKVYFELYKTGRTNANDGGIDFVMRPIGRFFQVTEVNNYDKYLLDIDKIMYFPISFVIKTKQSKEEVRFGLERYIEQRVGGNVDLRVRYSKAIEEIITINELQMYLTCLNDNDIDSVISDIGAYYRFEMNMGVDEEDS